MVLDFVGDSAKYETSLIYKLIFFSYQKTLSSATSADVPFEGAESPLLQFQSASAQKIELHPSAKFMSMIPRLQYAFTKLQLVRYMLLSENTFILTQPVPITYGCCMRVQWREGLLERRYPLSSAYQRALGAGN